MPHGVFDNPCFVIDAELSIQSPVHIDCIPEIIVVPPDHFEESSVLNSSEKRSLDIPSHLTSQLARPSICSTSSVPLEQLENFLSDANSNLEASPVAALRRFSIIHKIDVPQENYPRYFLGALSYTN